MTLVTLRSTMILAALAVIVIAIVAVWVGARRQRSALTADTERLIRAGAAHASSLAIDDEALRNLPPPVARYLRLALPSRKAIREVRITQTGTLRTDATAERWMAFEADHLAVPSATGFLWNARVRVAPLLHVRVRDSLIHGIGSGQVSLMSAFPVGAATGGLEMNSGSLHRYLAEAVWYPSALLPSSQLQWTPIDATRALATLTNDRVRVSLEFRFGDNGEVTGIYTPARWGTFGGGYKQVPWEGHFRDYRERDGVMVPTHGEVGWYIGDEWRAVWKGTVAAYQIRVRE
jgi:uncharacterized protein DUF6544